MNDLLVRNEVVNLTSLDYVELGNRFISVLDVKPNTLKGYKAGLKCFFSYPYKYVLYALFRKSQQKL